MITILPIFVAVLIAVFVDEDKDEDYDKEMPRKETGPARPMRGRCIYGASGTTALAR
jgi:hypothetical protein